VEDERKISGENPPAYAGGYRNPGLAALKNFC
jgi:hypothetical protein